MNKEFPKFLWLSGNFCWECVEKIESDYLETEVITENTTEKFTI